MTGDNRIISRIELPTGYNIRVGKALWYSLSFFLSLAAAALSRLSLPDGNALSLGVLIIAMLGVGVSAYYFYTFRDRVRWAIIAFTVASCFFTMEMLLRVWLDIRLI